MNHLTLPSQERIDNLKSFYHHCEYLQIEGLLSQWLIMTKHTFSVLLPFAYTVLLDNSSHKDFIRGGENNHSYHWVFLFGTRQDETLDFKSEIFLKRVKAYYKSNGIIIDVWQNMVENSSIPLFNDNGLVALEHWQMADRIARTYLDNN